MTVNQLRTFVVLATTGSVREAAQRLVVSQPAVSSVLASLQAELGVRLVEREGRGVRLTPAGSVLAGYGRRILGLWEEAVAATEAQGEPERGRLRLAAVTTAGEQVVPGLLTLFRRSYPAVDVTLDVGNRSRVWDMLQHGGVDLAIGGRPPAGSGLASLASCDNELVLVSAPDGAAGGCRQVTVEELARRTWLVREPGSGTGSTADELLAELGIEPPRLTLGSNGALRESALVGLGIALISRAAVARQLEDGALEEWRAGPLPLRRSWHLVERSGGPLPPTAGLFYRCVVAAGEGWVESSRTLSRVPASTRDSTVRRAPMSAARSATPRSP